MVKVLLHHKWPILPSASCAGRAFHFIRARWPARQASDARRTRRPTRRPPSRLRTGQPGAQFRGRWRATPEAAACRLNQRAPALKGELHRTKQLPTLLTVLPPLHRQGSPPIGAAGRREARLRRRHRGGGRRSMRPSDSPPPRRGGARWTLAPGSRRLDLALQASSGPRAPVLVERSAWWEGRPEGRRSRKPREGGSLKPGP